jgi:hypothetical protein
MYKNSKEAEEETGKGSKAIFAVRTEHGSEETLAGK